MQVMIFMALLSVAAQGFRIENNNLMEYDELAVEPLPPYTRHEEHVLKKDLRKPIIDDLSIVPISMITDVLQLFKNGVSFLLSKIPVVLFGTIAAFGACAFTPMCSTKILEILPTFTNIMKIYNNPEELTRTAEIVETAIRKFKAFNK